MKVDDDSYWLERARAPQSRLTVGKRGYSAKQMLMCIDDIVAGYGHEQLVKKYPHGLDFVVTTLSHGTMSIHKHGSVPPLAAGGWYERMGDKYVVAPGFAHAWRDVRNLRG